MPTYEYKCDKCGGVFEEFQSITAEPLKRCRIDGCEGEVRRLFSGGAGFIFKGSGFYHTDYKNAHTNNSSRKQSENKSEKSGKAESSGSGTEKTGSE